MLVKCPSCNTEYNCEPGKYQCACGVKFMCTPDGSVFVVSELDVNSRENMSSPGRMQAGVETNDMTIPMPGISGRKMAGRFKDGELILGRYMVLSELGQGSVGVVYKCFDETAKMVISVESLPPDLSQNTRKMEEVKKIFRLVCSLHHPKIVCCNALEMDHATGNYYLIMECIEGEDLRRWIERMRGEGGLTLKNVLPVIRQIASALDYAHGENVFLLDLKPGGIMIDQTGQVKMLGFGLAEQIRAGTTGGNLANPGTGDTAPYMAPEQWRGNPRNAATDQYALAVLSYEMLAGHLPFDGADEAALRQAVLTLDPEPIASLPEQAQAAIGQAMSKDPANRFLRCSDFVDALEGKNGESSAVSDSGPIRQEEWVSVSAAVPPQSPERRNATVPPRREPPEQKLPGGKKKRGRKVFGILFVLVAITAVILFAFYKRNEIPGLSGFVRNLVGEKQTSDDASDLIFDDITTSEPFDRVRPSDGEQPNNASVLIFDETKTIALSDNVNLELVKVEADSFEMSRKDGENEPGEVPHYATLTRDFYLGRTEVTQAQWSAVMGNNPSEFKGDDLPVEKVSWNDAMEFCEKLNSTGKAPSGWKFTLPTETQWEFAARGGNKSKGFRYSGSDNADEVAWYYENSGDNRLDDSSWDVNKLDSNHCKTHPVGQKKPNELGLYDMSGNVWEMCLDDYVNDSSKQMAEFARGNEQGGSHRIVWDNELGGPRRIGRIARGGDWRDIARKNRSSHRSPCAPDVQVYVLGFRVALVPAEGYGDKTIYLSDSVKLEMINVGLGTFEMSAKDGENIDNEVPHQATLTKDFYIGRTEVTQAQWNAVMGNNPSEFKGDDLPVEKVSWNDAMEFCEKLNSTGKAPSGWKFTLPTETQWEYAARGGNKSKGFKYSGSNNLDEVAWYSNNSDSSTHPVGQKDANELGLYDMSGNVYEWCLDDWQDKSDMLTPEFTRGNDRGGSPRVFRGGSWRDGCRSENRYHSEPAPRRRGDTGFRVALVPAAGYGSASEAKQVPDIAL